MKKLTYILAILLFTTFFGAQVALAVDAIPDAVTNGPVPDTQTQGPPAKPAQTIPTLGNPLKVDSIKDLLLKIADLLIFIGVIIAVLMFIFIGFKFVWAQGNDSELSEAKKWFMYCVIGTAILISSKVIVEVVKNTLTSAGVVDNKVWEQSI